MRGSWRLLGSLRGDGTPALCVANFGCLALSQSLSKSGCPHEPWREPWAITIHTLTSEHTSTVTERYKKKLSHMLISFDVYLRFVVQAILVFGISEFPKIRGPFMYSQKN